MGIGRDALRRAGGGGGGGGDHLTFCHVDREGAFGDLGSSESNVNRIWPFQDGPVGAPEDTVTFVFQHHLHSVPPALRIHNHYPDITSPRACKTEMLLGRASCVHGHPPPPHPPKLFDVPLPPSLPPTPPLVLSLPSFLFLGPLLSCHSFSFPALSVFLCPPHSHQAATSASGGGGGSSWSRRWRTGSGRSLLPEEPPPHPP